LLLFLEEKVVDFTADDLRTIGLIFVALFLLGLVISVLLLAYAVRTMRHLDIPPDAGLADTLHVTPFIVVVGIDLLDLTLDVLAAPVSWIILDRLGLRALRNMATIEALIPGTQVIPTLTLAWIIVRVFNITSDQSKMIDY
jgi:hypothetical protein